MFEKFLAYRWYKGVFSELANFEPPKNLLHLNKQIEIASKNTKALCSGYEALNMFFYGENGLGKSSLVKYLVNRFANYGLRCIDYLSDDVYTIYEVFDHIRKSSYKFFIYFDDLAFTSNDREFRKFKSIIEGSLEDKPNNCIFVVTSNKRRLIKQNSLSIDSNIYEKEEEGEKTSLFARFGLAVGFYELSVDQYLEVIDYYLDEFNVKKDFDVKKQSLTFASIYGIRSGRVAKQFAQYKLIEQLKV